MAFELAISTQERLLQWAAERDRHSDGRSHARKSALIAIAMQPGTYLRQPTWRAILMHRFLIATLFVLASSCASFSSTGLTNEISNIQFQNTTQTSVDVVWTTVHPSTSQVVLARDINYEPERLIPAMADPKLVTTHRVTVASLVPYNSATGDGQYYVYVASITSASQLSTAPGPQDGTGTHPLL